MRKKYLLYEIMVFKQVNLDFNEHIRYAFQKKKNWDNFEQSNSNYTDSQFIPNKILRWTRKRVNINLQTKLYLGTLIGILYL